MGRRRRGPSDAPRYPLFYDWPCAGSRLRLNAHRGPNPRGGALKVTFVTRVHERERPFSRDLGADRRECGESDGKVDLALGMLAAATELDQRMSHRAGVHAGNKAR